MIELSIAERIRAVKDIWDSIASVPEAVPLAEEQGQELDFRPDACHPDPDAGLPRLEVRDRIRRSARR